MPDPASESTAVAMLLGGAVCVGCIASFGFAILGALGIAGLPTGLLGATPTGYALSGAFLLAFLVLLVRGVRRNRGAAERGDPLNPYWVFHAPRALASLLLGFLAVAAVALIAKALIEGLTDLSYVIHWTRTVPFLGVAFGWVIHGEWNRKVLQDPVDERVQPA